MTQLFISPLTKYTTDTLQSLPYSTLSFFVNNSSTAKEVWADKNKVTSRGSIVTADSAGIFPPIWLDGTYRATLRSKSTVLNVSPADGTIQTGWPVDNIGDNVNFTAFSAWDAGFTYDTDTNTFVTGSDGLYYQAIILPSFNKDPISEPTYWQQIYFLPQWNASVNYAADLLVIYQGLLYKSNTTPNLNHAPPNLSFWDNVSFSNLVDGDFEVTEEITCDSLVVVTSISAATGAMQSLTLSQDLIVTDDITCDTIRAFQSTGPSIIADAGITVGNTEEVGATILDWYLEGSFTPVVFGSSAAGAGTYSVQTGAYTRIGNRVFFNLRVTYTGHTGTGNIGISGLPYAAANTIPTFAAYSDALVIGAGKCLFAQTSGTNLSFLTQDVAGGASANLAIDADASITVSGSYYV